MTGYAVAPDVLASHLEGEAVLLHLATKNYFRLNGTGAHIWKGIEKGQDADAIAASLVETFNVSREEADAGVAALIQQLSANKLVREAPAGG